MQHHYLDDAIAETRQTLDEYRRLAQSANSENVEIKARSREAIVQSRKLLADVDARLKRP
jgi:hypothetical protein